MREIPIQVTDEYVRGAGVAVGAAGSHDDVALRISFSPMWTGTARSIVWLDAAGENPTTTQLGTGLLAEGETEVYLVPIPAEPKALPGEMTMTIKGATVSGGKETTATLTAAARFRVLESAWDPDAEESADITPTQAEQLRSEIDAVKADIVVVRGVAAAEEGRKTAEEVRGKAESLRAEKETNRETAEEARQKAEEARVKAEAARETAEAARETAEAARAHWEEYQAEKSYSVGSKVAYGGSSYLCLAPCTGVTPPNAEYWLLIAARGTDGAGSMRVQGSTLIIQSASGVLPPSGYETYSGAYTVRSSLGGEDAEMETEGKLMRQNVTVEAVGLAEASNAAGGKTLIVGG